MFLSNYYNHNTLPDTYRSTICKCDIREKNFIRVSYFPLRWTIEFRYSSNLVNLVSIFTNIKCCFCINNFQIIYEKREREKETIHVKCIFKYMNLTMFFTFFFYNEKPSRSILIILFRYNVFSFAKFYLFFIYCHILANSISLSSITIAYVNRNLRWSHIIVVFVNIGRIQPKSSSSWIFIDATLIRSSLKPILMHKITKTFTFLTRNPATTFRANFYVGLF